MAARSRSCRLPSFAADQAVSRLVAGVAIPARVVLSRLLLFVVVYPAAIDRDQAELRRDEHTIGDDQQAYGKEAERGVDRGLPDWGTRAGVRTAGSVSPPPDRGW